MERRGPSLKQLCRKFRLAMMEMRPSVCTLHMRMDVELQEGHSPVPEAPLYQLGTGVLPLLLLGQTGENIPDRSKANCSASCRSR